MSLETLVMMTPDVDDGGQVPVKDRNSGKNLCKIKEYSLQNTIHTISGSVANSV